MLRATGPICRRPTSSDPIRWTGRIAVNQGDSETTFVLRNLQRRTEEEKTKKNGLRLHGALKRLPVGCPPPPRLSHQSVQRGEMRTNERDEPARGLVSDSACRWLGLQYLCSRRASNGASGARRR